MLDCSTERESAQVEDDITHDANRKAAPDPVEAPVGYADEQHDQSDEQAGSQGGMSTERVQSLADHHRLRGRDDCHQDRQDDNDSHPGVPGSEIPDDAARQLAVRILTVVLFFVESFVEAHR